MGSPPPRPARLTAPALEATAPAELEARSARARAGRGDGRTPRRWTGRPGGRSPASRPGGWWRAATHRGRGYQPVTEDYKAASHLTFLASL